MLKAGLYFEPFIVDAVSVKINLHMLNYYLCIVVDMYQLKDTYFYLHLTARN